jgi:NADPH2:quinone reductase
MRAAWYERQGPAREVIVVGEMPDPRPGPGEVRIRLAASGINPGDVKKRGDAFGVGMPFPRVIPHSDGAGVIDEVGEGVTSARVGERAWCFGAQSYRPFGTAAGHTVVPASQAVRLPDGVSFEQGACLGIPGLTAHRAVHAAGPVRGRTLLVQGGAGAVGSCAVALARHAGAQVIATVRSERDGAAASRAGAHLVVRADGADEAELVERIQRVAPQGVHHVVEVAFHANVRADERVLAQGGSIATYATGEAAPTVPFWPLVFKNVSVHFLGSDDFPAAAKAAAAADLNEAMAAGWPGFEILRTLPLDSIAEAHELVEKPPRAGRVVLAWSTPAASP